MPAILSSGDAFDAVSASDLESGYVSGHSSQGSSSPDVVFTNPHLIFLNRQLQNLEPQGTSFPPAAHIPGDLSNPEEWQRYYNGASPQFPPYFRSHRLVLLGSSFEICSPR